MNVVHLNTDDQAGASRSAMRLHLGLKRLANINSVFVVGRSKTRVEGGHTLEPKGISRLTKVLYSGAERYLARSVEPSYQHLVSFNRLPRLIHPYLNRFHPDIVNLHWIGNGFIPIASLARIRVPVVWTMHDMWGFTGGCHYDNFCGNYVRECQCCPMFPAMPNRNQVLASWKAKQSAYAKIRMTVVCPSQWMAACVRQSSLMRDHRIEVIPYGLDTTLFRPSDKSKARQILGLPQNKKVILFGAVAADKRKGYGQLVDCLKRLRGSSLADQIILTTFGRVSHEIESLGFPVHFFGRIREDTKLTSIYSASDLFVAPSEQDNLPNTVLEAMACGVPCVAFRIGGMPDLIAHQSAGYLAEPYEIEDLARGICWVLSEPERHEALAKSARKLAEEHYHLMRQANAYAKLYAELQESAV